MTEQFSRWDSADYLKTEEDIELYFDACIAEDPGDGSLIRHALGAIARARGMTQLAVIPGWPVRGCTGHCPRTVTRSFQRSSRSSMRWGSSCGWEQPM